MAKDGLITRKDIIEDDALNLGPEYAKNMQQAIKANKELVASLKEMAPLVNTLRNVTNQQDFVKAKQEENLVTLKAINANKVLEASQISANRIKQSAIALSESERKAIQATTDAEMKAQKSKQSGLKLTIDERVQNELNNKALKQEARERLGLVGAYEKLNKARTDAKNKLRDLLTAENASTSSIKKAQKEYDILDGKVRKADAAVGDFTKNVGNYGGRFGAFTSGVSNLLGAFGIVGGLSLFAGIAKDIYSTTKEMQSLENALKQVTGTNENFIEQQQFLTRISEAYGVELKGLTKQYTQFYVSAKDKLAGEEIQKIFESITKAGAAMGLSVESQDRAFLALNQMMSKGTIQAEELRGQLGEALPGALGIMAKAVGVNEKELAKMMKNGDLLAKDVLPKFAEQLEITYGIENKNRIDSITASQNRLSNAWLEFIVSLNDRNSLGTALKWVTDELTSTVQGWRKIFTNNGKLQEEEMASIRKSGFDSIKKSYSDVNKYSESQLNSIKTINSAEIAENAKKVNALIADNARLSKDKVFLTGAVKNDSFAIIVENRKKIAELNKISTSLLGKNEGINSLNNSRNIKVKNDPIEETDAEKKARLARDKKAAQDRLDLEQKLANSLYELQKQRLEQTIKFNNEIVADDTESDEMRLKALSNSQKKQNELLLLTRNRLLDNDKITANDRIRINEDYANKLLDVEKNIKKESDKITQFDEVEYQKSLEDKLSKNNEAMNKELAKENERFNKLGNLELLSQKDREAAVEAHEREIFEIKKRYAIEGLKLQISNLETELAASDALPIKDQITADKRQKIAETLSKAKLDLTEVEAADNKFKGEKKVEVEKLTATKILEISQSLTGALSDLSNSIFDAKIQNIDFEIDKNNEYYNKQIELAGNDERQKAILENERAKKEKKLQEDKRKEQRKQAIFDKAAAVAQAGISAALAVLNALNTKPFLPLGPIMATVAGALGAIQVAAILATPIPKYKMGRKSGPAEMAWTGDGGVKEVISRPDGSGAFATPNTPTLTYLEKDDMVHKSVADYNEYMRRSLLKGFHKERDQAKNFQSSNKSQGESTELLKELKRNTAAIQKQKTNVILSNKIDFGHQEWKRSNTDWNR